MIRILVILTLAVPCQAADAPALMVVDDAVMPRGRFHGCRLAQGVLEMERKNWLRNSSFEWDFEKLVAFRDDLIKRPRPRRFDVRVVMETGERLYARKPPHSSFLDMTQQPYAALFRHLDGRGYVWYYTTRQAMEIQEVSAAATVDLREYRGKTPAEQTAMIVEALRGVQPSGTPLPWPDN